MNEPVSATGITATSLIGASFLSFWSGIPASVIICSFAGAVVYVLSNSDIPIFKRLSFFLVSFFAGIYGAEAAAKTVESVVSTLVGNKINVDISIGALVASAVAIKLILSLVAKVAAPNPPTGGSSE